MIKTENERLRNLLTDEEATKVVMLEITLKGNQVANALKVAVAMVLVDRDLEGCDQGAEENERLQQMLTTKEANDVAILEQQLKDKQLASPLKLAVAIVIAERNLDAFETGFSNKK